MRGRPIWEGKLLLEALRERESRFFRFEDAMVLSGESANATVKLIQRLNRDGLVVRIEQGLYGLGGERLNKLAVGRELAGGDGYSIGYGSALEVHGMAEASPCRIL